jgi:hypothetical protein
MAGLTFQKKVIVLGACIGLLAAAYVLGLVFSPARVEKRQAETPLIPGFNRQRNQVAEILIDSKEGSLQLVKQEDSWILPGEDRDYPASQSRIDAFLDFIQDLKRTRIVTDNPDSWEEFQVQTDAPSRFQLLDSSGAGLAEIIVGKSAEAGGNNYVRLADANEIVLANRTFDYYMSVKEEFWAYLRVFPKNLDGQDIMRISVNSTLQVKDQSLKPLDYTLVLSSEQPAEWKLVEGPKGELDNSKVDLLANNLADLEGTQFAHGVDRQKAGLATPAAQILISTQDDRDFRLLIGGQAGEDRYYAGLEEGDFIYEVSEWRVKGILKDAAELRAEKQQQE